MKVRHLFRFRYAGTPYEGTANAHGEGDVRDGVAKKVAVMYRVTPEEAALGIKFDYIHRERVGDEALLFLKKIIGI